MSPLPPPKKPKILGKLVAAALPVKAGAAASSSAVSKKAVSKTAVSKTSSISTGAKDANGVPAGKEVRFGLLPGCAGRNVKRRF